MFFQHVYDKSLAQASYVVGCQVSGEAIVIDARRDIDIYLKIAADNNLKITHITETHIHADFLAGSGELASVTRARLYLSDEGGPDWQYQFEHIGLKDGDLIRIGNLSLEVMHTPGHTPESISFLLTDHPASDEPVMIFTGDFVFVGDIGRPDLLEKAAGLLGSQEKGARQMYASVQRFAGLAPHIQVWPGHGAGSACGKALSAVPSSTTGYEKLRNWAFKHENDEVGFTDYLLSGQPEPPKYFSVMKQLNKVSRPLLTEVPQHVQLTTTAFKKAFADGLRIIDTRNKADFAKGFIPGSINIQHNNSLATWTGWILNYQEQFVIIADPAEVEEITRKLMRIGLDNIYGFFSNIEDSGIGLQTAEVIDLDDFKSLRNKINVQVLDVRGANEYNSSHIMGAENFFAGTIEENLNKISKSKQLVIHCQSGDRATIAYSILRRNGFEKVKIFSGGMKEWLANK